MEFATKRWGRTGVIFGWDLWNEINPSHAGNKSELMNDFVEDLGIYIKKIEIELFGKAHLQTVSIYGHQMIQHDHVSTMLFRNPVLDFASTHFYEKGTIDNPKNTIDPAFACGKLVEEALHEITDNRPFLDTEHGPIYKYKKNNKGLARKFDEEYFHNFQWAHFASGGCGGGMRWPYRQPHQLTLPMRNSQHSLAEFAKIIRWDIKNRFNYNSKINIKPSTYYTFCFGDNNHFVLWILRNNFIDKQGVLICKEIESVEVELPWITFGYYRVILWNTRLSYIVQILEIEAKESGLKIIISSVDRDIVLYGGLMSTTINQ